MTESVLQVAGIIFAVQAGLAIVVATLVVLTAKAREERDERDAPTSHRADRHPHAHPGWQLAPSTPRYGTGVVRFNAGTVDDTVMFRAVVPAVASTSGDAA